MQCRRLEKHIYIPFPNFESRKELIRINLKTIEILDQIKSFFEFLLLGHTLPCHLEVATDVDIDEVARGTEGYSEDALTNVCRDASLNGMSAVFPKQIWRSMGSGSRNLDQPKGDETRLMMKTTADWYLLCMFCTKNLAFLL
ncbi:hypothetical protein Peur_063340 [Populus x canadensis]